MANEIIPVVSQIPWTSIITGGIGVLGALSGAFLANIFAEKRWEKQIAYEKGRERINFIRGKGEELHLLLSQWGKSTFLYQLNQLQVVHGNLTEQQFHEIAKDIALEKGMHDRLETLLFLYFSELEPYMKKLREKISEGNTAYDAALKGALNPNEAITRLDLASEGVEAELEKIKAGIRHVIKSFQ
ncbi:hypothetical protein ACS25O_002428 [Enterobacter ludwigii]